jgi:hypothetical protein
MRKSKFNASQIMDTVNRAEAGFAVPNFYRDFGIGIAKF